MAERDLYSILGVARDADKTAIKKAYRSLAKQYHPDVNDADPIVEQKFKEVGQAYRILSDDALRGKYDRGEIDNSGQPVRRGFGRAASGAAAGARRGGFSFDAEDIFGDFFGRGRRKPGNGPAMGAKTRGADVEYSVRISFLEAALGVRKRLHLAGGRSVMVNVPAGTEDQQTLRLRGQGQPGRGGGPAGDAFVEVHVDPHPYFRREGEHIYLTLPITLQEAVLGASITVPTTDGKVSLKVPAGANTGTRLRLKGKGVLDREKGTRGDQYVVLQVVLPDNIDKDLKDFMEQWGPDHSYDVRAKHGLGGG